MGQVHWATRYAAELCDAEGEADEHHTDMEDSIFNIKPWIEARAFSTWSCTDRGLVNRSVELTKSLQAKPLERFFQARLCLVKHGEKIRMTPTGPQSCLKQLL